MTIKEFFQRVYDNVQAAPIPPYDHTAKPRGMVDKEVILFNLTVLMEYCELPHDSVVRQSGSLNSTWHDIVTKVKSYGVFKEFEGNEEVRKMLDEWLEPGREEFQGEKTWDTLTSAEAVAHWTM